MKVLGDRRRFAVWDTVLAQVSGTESRRGDFQRAALRQRSRRRGTAALTAPAAARRNRARAVADLCTHRVLVAARRALPLRAREPLPGWLAAGRLRAAELEQPRLRARIEFEFQCVVVGPRD